MNPAYAHVRFRAELPKGGLPERFGIVTAWNPDCIPTDTASNQTAKAHLEAILLAEALPHFPVIGGSPDFTHAEPGFAIIADQARILALGREFRQESVFWIDRGTVHLVPCSDAPPQVVGSWNELATGAAAHPLFHFRGPLSLLDTSATAFFSSTQCPGDAILTAYAWARCQCDEHTAVISGFHTPVEHDVLAILARRDAHIIWVPARDLPKKIPAEFTAVAEEERLLILSPFDYGRPVRATRESCSKRNQFILRMKQNRYIAHSSPGTALAADIRLADQALPSFSAP
ncbi:MAG: DUF3293 domain-containing protein [Prosthecobacter sp.]